MKKLKEMRDANRVEVQFDDEVEVDDILNVVIMDEFQNSLKIVHKPQQDNMKDGT